MNRNIISFILFSGMLLQVACRCDKVDCKDGDTIKLRWMKDGHNALFGPDSFLNRDSIRLFNSEFVNESQLINYNDQTETMDLYIVNGIKYFLELNNTEMDTLSANFISIGKTDCCEKIKMVNVKLNGNVVCQDNCNEIIEIQL